MKDLPLESISIQVLGYNSKKVYVHSYGPGRMVAIPFTGDLTVLDAITNSGLLTRTSNEKRIRITRGVSDPDKKPQVFGVNLNDIVKKGRYEYNMVLRPNDIVYIPPTILGRIGYTVQDVLFPVRPVEQIGRTAASVQYNALGFGASKLGSTSSNRSYR
jgi:protein involved in polysaccharide export with SLBB domain